MGPNVVRPSTQAMGFAHAQPTLRAAGSCRGLLPPFPAFTALRAMNNRPYDNFRSALEHFRHRLPRTARGRRPADHKLSMMSPPQRRAFGPSVRRIVARRQGLLCEQFSTPQPSLRHAPPSLLVLGLAGELGHQLAFSGMLQKLFRRVHRRYYSLSFSD